jgi:hypothetical protein
MGLLLERGEQLGLDLANECTPCTDERALGLQARFDAEV